MPTKQAIGLYGTAILIDFTIFGAILTALPFILVGEYGTPPVIVGGVITANLIVGALVSANSGRLATRFSERQLIGMGFVAMGVGLLASWMANGPIQFGVTAAVFGSGYGLIFPSVDASISAVAPSRYRAGALSLRNSATFLGRGTGPLVFALAAASLGYRSVLAISGGAIVLAGIGTLIWTRVVQGALLSS